MIRMKPKKTVEDLYTSAPPPTANTRYDDDYQLVPNSKKNKEKTDVIRKKSKGRSFFNRKDEKTLVNEEKSHIKMQAIDDQLQRNKQLLSAENEKDDDSEEFFEIIKEVVERAVEKSLKDIISWSLKDMIMKIDSVRDLVNSHDNALEKVQADLMSKIVHYGEENSRHFRYLCMKSEYDKMFYQHQNMMPYTQPIPSHAEVSPSQNLAAQHQHIKSSTLKMECKCIDNSGLMDFDNGQRSKLSINSKSSDMGIREVKELLEQLKRFYEQHSADKTDRNGQLLNKSLNMPEQNDSNDGDEDDDCSDDITSQSNDENII